MAQIIIYLFALINLATPNNYLEYHELINQATYTAYQKNYEKSDSLFQEAIKLVETPFIKDYSFAINNALELNDFEKTFSYLKTAVQLGLSKEKIEKKSWFSQIENRVEWFLLTQEYPALWAEYESQFDVELRQAIKEIYQRDQDFRLNGGENFDDKNLERLKKIVAEQGYPGFHQIGQDINLSIVFHHFSPEDNEQHFYKILNKAIFTGNISPYEYGGIIDYDQFKRHQPLIYGTYFVTVDGIRYLQPVENFDTLDEKRKTIGLESIQHFLERFNIMYDPNFRGF